MSSKTLMYLRVLRFIQKATGSWLIGPYLRSLLMALFILQEKCLTVTPGLFSEADTPQVEESQGRVDSYILGVSKSNRSFEKLCSSSAEVVCTTNDFQVEILWSALNTTLC